MRLHDLHDYIAGLKALNAIPGAEGVAEDSLKFWKAVATWMETVEGIIHADYERNYPNVPKPALAVDNPTAPKNIRIVILRYPDAQKVEDQQPAVHVFIDRTTGDVLKAAGYKAPAKGARGNVYDPTRLGVDPKRGTVLYNR